MVSQACRSHEYRQFIRICSIGWTFPMNDFRVLYVELESRLSWGWFWDLYPVYCFSPRAAFALKTRRFSVGIATHNSKHVELGKNGEKPDQAKISQTLEGKAVQAKQRTRVFEGLHFTNPDMGNASNNQTTNTIFDCLSRVVLIKAFY